LLSIGTDYNFAQNKFINGDRVKANTINPLNVRSGPGTNYSLLTFQALNGETGRITGGPTYDGTNYYWYKVKWDKNAQEGWSYQDGLEKVTTSSGNITITLKNINGTSTPLPGANGTIRLYNSSWGHLVNAATNSSGVATFNNRAYAAYNIEGYHMPSNPTTIFEEEFWGATSVNHNSSNTIVSLTRNMPYSEQIIVKNNVTGAIVTGQSVAVGTVLRFEITVKNPSTVTREIRARLVVDRDKLSGYDYDFISTSANVTGNNGTGTLTFSTIFTASNAGDYYGVAGTQTNINSNWATTNGDAWTANKLGSTVNSVKMIN